jgi:hypothetical protein
MAHVCFTAYFRDFTIQAYATTSFYSGRTSHCSAFLAPRPNANPADENGTLPKHFPGDTKNADPGPAVGSSAFGDSAKRCIMRGRKRDGVLWYEITSCSLMSCTGRFTWFGGGT